MKNYYEILEINKNASQDVIEKVYKVLVKKYHPDLQSSPEGKAKCEAKIKEINEAYDVLSNDAKRKEYDDELNRNAEEEKVAMNNAHHIQNENIQTQEVVHENVVPQQPPVYSSPQYNPEELKRRMEQQQQDYQNAINKAYHDAYIQDLKNRGYKIKYKKTWNERLRSLIALLITIGVVLLIFQIPFVKNYFQSFYNENEIFRNIIDGITGLFR